MGTPYIWCTDIYIAKISIYIKIKIKKRLQETRTKRNISAHNKGHHDKGTANTNGKNGTGTLKGRRRQGSQPPHSLNIGLKSLAMI